MVRRTLLMVLALVLVAGGAACGGGGDDAAADDPSDRDAAADEDEGAAQSGETTTTPSTAPAAPAAPGVEPGGEPGTAPGGEGPSAGDGAPGGIASELGIDRTFTGEGSDGFCTQVDGMRAAGGDDPAAVDEAAFAGQMAAIPPPAEIATEWTNLFTVQQAIAADPSGNALAAMSQAELDAWGMSGAVVAAYLGDVCGFTDSGG
jgi:hypothetical protein